MGMRAEDIEEIENTLLKSHAPNRFNITSIQEHNNGFVVLFTITYLGKVTAPDEHRVAFFHYISIETENDTLMKKLDFIC